MDFTKSERAAMQRALQLAVHPTAPTRPNPRVGCVLLNQFGEVVAEGFHLGTGTDHAEAAALKIAGPKANGATAIVTLEPCNHTGRTGPCAQALIAAGVSKVIYAQADPNPLAAGGAATLQAAGVEVQAGLLAEEAIAINPIWNQVMARQRPWVIWKFGATMDGRIAAQDTSSKWITSDAARADAQQIRAQVDAIMVGTNTVLIDNPALTVRTASVTEPPLRVIVGRRELSSDLQIFDSAAETVQLSGTPAGVLQQLQQRGVQKILLEGGPTLAAAFLAAGYIDEIVGYLAPKFLGSGANLIADLGINNVQAALTLEVAQVQLLPGEPNNIKVILQKVN